MDATGDLTEPHVLILRVPAREDIAARALPLVVEAATRAIEARGRYLIALAGGSTPAPLYAHLAQQGGIDWSRWRLYWGDERTVPPDHESSNFHMVKETLLRPLAERGLAPGHVERMRGELPPAQAADLYEAAVRNLGVPLPRFDLVLLGMGADAHTASLFPYTAALHERNRLVVANEAPQLATTRLTMTYPLLNAARQVLFLVSGDDKAQALAAVFGTTVDHERWPSQAIRPANGGVVWIVDEAAAALLPPSA